jgi:hemolysin III
MGRRRSNIRWRVARRRNVSPWAAFGARLLAQRRLARRHQRVQASVEESGETLYEEIANAVVSGVAAVLSAAGLALLVVLAANTHNFWAVTASAVYGATLFLAFLFSSLYHGVWHRGTKEVLLALDHVSIFLLIAGTYTPITLLAFPRSLGWTLCALIWIMVAIGVAVRLISGHMHWLLIPVFLALGWLGFAWAGTIFENMGSGGGWLLLSGGFAYTVGVGFYLWRSLPFNHAIWHVFVFCGAVCHFLAVALYAVPNVA